MIGQELFDNVLPSDGLLCIVGLVHGRASGAIYRYFNMGDEAAGELIEELDKDGREVYFGCASYQDASVPKNVRNIHSLKSFYVDLDCGVDKDYKTQKEAFSALTDFCKATGLPVPTLINSGFGIHAYWPLTTAIDYNTWKPIADALKKRAAEFGLKADPVVTADGARILRIPGTVNKKRDNKHKDVKVVSVCEPMTLDVFSAAISYIPFGVYAESTNDPVMQKLLHKSNKYKFSRIYRKSLQQIDVNENVEEEYTEADGTKALRLVQKKIKRSAGCPQIAYCVANRETLGEPMWHAALSIAWFCTDQVEGIDMVSRGYPGTEPDEWYSKASRSLGPRTCLKWRELQQPQLCGQCIHRGKITTPLVLGVTIEAATPEDNVISVQHETLDEKITIEVPEYPFPWIRPKTGGVALRGQPDEVQVDEDDDPEESLIYDRDLWVKERSRDGEQEYALLALMLPNDGLSEFMAPLASLFKNDALRDLLAAKGVHIASNPKKLELIKRYIGAWVKKLQDEGEAKRARTQFGWQDNDTKFIIGNREINDKGEIHFCPTAKSIETISKMYNKKGALEEWRSVVNTYARPGNQARAFSLFGGFGAPLYKFIGEGSCVLHLTNVASGVGKSTIQKVVNSIWGNPVDTLLTSKDTHNAKLNRAGVMNNLPMCIDEVTNMGPELTSNLAFDLSSGKGKNRMHGSANVERVNETSWATMFQTSGNNSLHDTLRQHKTMVEGEMYRIMEIPVALDTALAKNIADELFTQKLPRNYGVAGEEFMKYVVANKENVVQLLFDIQKKFDAAAQLTSKERFYSAGCAAVFTGGIIANKLGIIDIPIEPIWDWAIEMIRDNVQSIRRAAAVGGTGSYEEIVNRYWNEILPQVLVVHGGVSPVDETLMAQSSLKPVIGSLKGRYDINGSKLYISVSDFEFWMANKRLPTAQIVAMLKQNSILEKETQFNLGLGTKLYSTAPVKVYVFNTDLLSVPES